ncbi:hypothetical protein DL96DRAFT_1710578 [Flagelloscypha sp. PMI_526]|nr:hypothetical protein DL96DRAFT_1710578 [Flagelloscypha sp. PMI_526]
MSAAPTTPEEQKALVESLIRLVDAGNVVVIFEFAALAILVWDWLITLDTEIRLVWPSRWTLGKVLFFFTRYMSLADVLMSIARLQLMDAGDDSITCPKPYLAIVWLDVVGIQIAELILVLRTWAVYGRNMWVLAGLLILQSATFIYNGIAVQIFVHSIKWAGPDLAGIPGCNIIAADAGIISGTYVAIMAFETTIFLVTMARALQREQRKSGSQLVHIIYRDGLIFYLFIVFVSTVNVVIIFTAPQEYTVVLSIFQRVMHSVATGRILLHMRESTERPQIHIGSANEGGTEVWQLDTLNAATSGLHSSGGLPTHAPKMVTAYGSNNLKVTAIRPEDAVTEWFGDENTRG